MIKRFDGQRKVWLHAALGPWITVPVEAHGLGSAGLAYATNHCQEFLQFGEAGIGRSPRL